MAAARVSDWKPVACTECALRHLPAFERFDPAQIEIISALRTEHRRAPPDGVLFHAGETVPVITIYSGWALRLQILPNGRRQILGVLLPGDTVGLEFLAGHPAHYSVRAVTEVAYCVLHTSSVTEAMMAHPWFSQRVLHLLWREWRLNDEWVTRIGTCSAEERIVSLLLDLHARLVPRGMARGGQFTLRLTQQHIADTVGLNVIHVNRVLRRLRVSGLLSVAADRLVSLHDVGALRTMVPSLDGGGDACPLL